MALAYLYLFVISDVRQMESEVASMTKRVRLLEEDFEGTETKLQNTSAKLDEATKAADESERYYQLNHYSRPIYSVTARGRGYAYAIG